MTRKNGKSSSRTVKGRAQVKLQFVAQQIATTRVALEFIAAAPAKLFEGYTGVAPQTILVEEFDDSWECMKDRAVKLERLDKFYAQCKRDRHELTAVEHNMCEAVEIECRRKASVLPSCTKHLILA